jgi:hypothetical protein
MFGEGDAAASSEYKDPDVIVDKDVYQQLLTGSDVVPE